MSGSEENINGPENSTSVSPISVQGPKSRATSETLWRRIPSPRSRKSTIAMVPTNIANPAIMEDLQRWKDQLRCIERIRPGK